MRNIGVVWMVLTRVVQWKEWLRKWKSPVAVILINSFLKSTIYNWTAELIEHSWYGCHFKDLCCSALWSGLVLWQVLLLGDDGWQGLADDQLGQDSLTCGLRTSCPLYFPTIAPAPAVLTCLRDDISLAFFSSRSSSLLLSSHNSLLSIRHNDRQNPHI